MEQLVAYLKSNRGQQIALARHLGLSPSTVSQWKDVPPEHVRRVAEFTGISPATLRPDLYEWMEAG